MYAIAITEKKDGPRTYDKRSEIKAKGFKWITLIKRGREDWVYEQGSNLWVYILGSDKDPGFDEKEQEIKKEVEDMGFVPKMGWVENNTFYPLHQDFDERCGMD